LQLRRQRRRQHRLVARRVVICPHNAACRPRTAQPDEIEALEAFYNGSGSFAYLLNVGSTLREVCDLGDLWCVVVEFF
jgi:hypothetical protein